MITPSGQKRGRAFVGDLMPPATPKTRARAEGRTKKGRFYRPLPTRFRHNGFDYRQIARKGDAAIYEQRWTGCPDTAVGFEVIRVRRREGFRIGGRFVQPADVYPKSELWGVDGFTVTDRNSAWDKFFEISLEEPAMKGKEVN
jgi:hypothetical protein